MGKRKAVMGQYKDEFLFGFTLLINSLELLIVYVIHSSCVVLVE